MNTHQQKIDKSEVVRRTKVETTYEYVPILGEILGYWRTVKANRLGEEVQVHLNHTIGEYDRLFINGVEVDKVLLTPHSH